MHRRSLRLAFCTSLLLVVPLACSSSSGHVDAPKPVASASVPIAVTPPPPSACEVAANLRAKVKPFLDEGRLHRTVKLIEKADRLCPRSAPETWSALVTTLAELGKYAEARNVAAQIEADPKASAEAKAAAISAKEKCDKLDRTFPDNDDAKKEMRELFMAAQLAEQKDDAESKRLAKEKYLAAWEAWRPNGQALLAAGFTAKKLGLNAEAQRLFDRAVEDAEKAQDKAVAIDVPDGFIAEIKSITWSRDGRRFAVAHGREISIFDTTWREKYRLRGHAQPVRFLAFSPDGKTLASGSDEWIIRLWDVATGKEIRKLEGHTNSVRDVTYSPDGKTLASGSSDDTVRIWDATSGKEIRKLDMKPHEVYSLWYSLDGKTLIIDSKRIQVWNIATGKLIRALPARSGYLAAFSPDGKTVVLLDNEGMQLLDVVKQKEIRKFEKSRSVVRAAYSPDGKTLASGGDDGRVRLWDVATGKEIRTFEGYIRYATGIHSVAYSPDGKTIASGSRDQAVQFWDVATGKEIRRFVQHSSFVTSLAYSPDGTTLASGLDDKTVRLWDIATRNGMRKLAGRELTITAIGYSPDGRMLASGSNEGLIVRLWDVATGKELRQLGAREMYPRRVTAVAYSTDGKELALGSESMFSDKDSNVHVWDVVTGEFLRDLEGHAGSVQSLAYSPDGKTLASGSLDTTIKLWDVATKNELRTLKGPSGVISVAYSPDGKTLASGAYDTMIRLWDVATGNEIRRLRGHTAAVNSVAYAPDGKTLASGATDSSVLLWDAGTGAELRKLEGHERAVNTVAYSHDGKMVASSGKEGIFFHRVDDGALAAILRGISSLDAGYVFTPESHIDLLAANPCTLQSYPVCRIGNLVFPFEVCAERFYVPGLLAKVHAGDTSYLEPENAPPIMKCADVPQ